MVKMLYAFIAILLMFIANFSITYARKLKKGVIRSLISIFAFLLLIPSAVLILVVILG